MFYRRKNKNPRNLLELIPERSKPFRQCDDGNVEVIMPRYGNSRLGKMMASLIKDRPIKIKLDKVGTLIWQLCDGNHSVAVIAEELRKNFGEAIEPAHDRLAVFFRQMDSRGLIDWKDQGRAKGG